MISVNDDIENVRLRRVMSPSFYIICTGSQSKVGCYVSLANSLAGCRP